MGLPCEWRVARSDFRTPVKPIGRLLQRGSMSRDVAARRPALQNSRVHRPFLSVFLVTVRLLKRGRLPITGDDPG